MQGNKVERNNSSLKGQKRRKVTGQESQGDGNKRLLLHAACSQEQANMECGATVMNLIVAAGDSPLTLKHNKTNCSKTEKKIFG